MIFVQLKDKNQEIIKFFAPIKKSAVFTSSLHPESSGKINIENKQHFLFIMPLLYQLKNRFQKSFKKPTRKIREKIEEKLTKYF